MNRRILAYLVVLSAGAAAAGAWLMATPDQAGPDRTVVPPSVAVSKASIVLRHRGQKQAEIASERVEVSADGRLATFTGAPQAVLFDDGQPALTVTGSRMVFDRQSRDVTVDGGLRITTSRGYALRAPSGAWNQQAQVVDLTGGVEVVAAAPTAPRSPAGGDAGQGRLRADRVRYDARTRVVVATGNVSLVVGDLEIRADSMRLEQGPQLVTAEGRVVVRQREMQLTTPTLRYLLQDAIGEASGGAVLIHKDVTIKAPQLRFDLREEVTTAQGGVEVAQAGNTLTAASLRYQAKTGDVSADGGVKLIQAGSTLDGRRLLANLQTRRADVREDVTFSKDDTTVTAGRVVFRWDVNEAEAEENVVVRQKDKTAWADRMTYSEPSNRLVMTGRVTLEQMSGDRLTRVTCSRLVMTLRERDITVEGPLRVTQKDRWATGDRGAYTEATRRLVMTGNVMVQETDGRRLQADRVTISLVDETFEAEGNVQTQFVIPHRP